MLGDQVPVRELSSLRQSYSKVRRASTSNLRTTALTSRATAEESGKRGILRSLLVVETGPVPFAVLNQALP